MNTTLNSITFQRFRALQNEIIPLVEQDSDDLISAHAARPKGFQKVNINQLERVIFQNI